MATPREMDRVELLEQRATGVAIFRGGLISIPGVILAFIYLELVTNASSALIGLFCLTVLPVLFCLVGALIVRQANAFLRERFSMVVPGMLHRQKPITPPENESFFDRYERDFD